MEITERNGVPRRRYEVSKQRMIEHALRDSNTIRSEEERAAELSFDNMARWNGLRYEFYYVRYDHSKFRFSMKVNIDTVHIISMFQHMNEAAAWILAYDAENTLNTQGGNYGEAATETE